MGTLQEVYCYADGHAWHGCARGTGGDVNITRSNSEEPPPMEDPCPSCEHRNRPECSTVDGCPTAEAWESAANEYARRTVPDA